MLHENKDILFEGRDTQNRKVLWFGIWLFIVMGVTALLMIPLVHYLWDAVKEPGSASAPVFTPPGVVLEVLPSQELSRMRAEIKAKEADKQINQAMKDTLAQGFPVKS